MIKKGFNPPVPNSVAPTKSPHISIYKLINFFCLLMQNLLKTKNRQMAKWPNHDNIGVNHTGKLDSEKLPLSAYGVQIKLLAKLWN